MTERDTSLRSICDGFSPCSPPISWCRSRSAWRSRRRSASMRPSRSFRSQWLAAGYGPQPPFYNWLQYFVFSVAGVSLATLSVVKNRLLFASYALYGLTARHASCATRALVAIATLGLLTHSAGRLRNAARPDAHGRGVLSRRACSSTASSGRLKQPGLASYLVAGSASASACFPNTISHSCPPRPSGGAGGCRRCVSGSSTGGWC